MSATITDEQFAVRDLIRSWAAGTGAPDTVRDVEHGRGDAWQAVYDGIAELGLFGVAVEESAGGAGGSAGTKGNVIIRYAGAQRGTGGTVNSAGGYTYHMFTSEANIFGSTTFIT